MTSNRSEYKPMRALAKSSAVRIMEAVEHLARTRPDGQGEYLFAPHDDGMRDRLRVTREPETGFLTYWIELVPRDFEQFSRDEALYIIQAGKVAFVAANLAE